MTLVRRTIRRPPLPYPPRNYDPRDQADNRAQIRRTIEDLDNEIDDVRLTRDGASTLALRRHQFLLMGA